MVQLFSIHPRALRGSPLLLGVCKAGAPSTLKESKYQEGLRSSRDDRTGRDVFLRYSTVYKIQNGKFNMPGTHKIESIFLHALENIISGAREPPLTASPEASTPGLVPRTLQHHEQMVPESYRGKEVCIVSGRTGSKEPWLL